MAVQCTWKVEAIEAHLVSRRFWRSYMTTEKSLTKSCVGWRDITSAC